MNRLKCIFPIVLSIYLMISCTNDDDFISSYCDESTKDIVLQDRQLSVPHVKKLPLKAIIDKTTRSGSNSGNLIGDSEAMLGYSYTIGNSILGDMENVKFPVLDLAKIKAKYPTSVIRKPLNSSASYSFSYNGMSRYETNSQISKTVKSGFSLNVGLFKIGREKKMTELFKSSSSYGSNCVYGELNIEIKGSQYELLSTIDKRKIYARECLSQTFLTDLYRGTIGNLIDSYGPFVLRSYITGGKATAFYAGKSVTGSDSQTREKGLTDDINASFSWKSGSNSASGNLSFGNNNGESSSSQYETQETEIYIQTFGGTPTLQTIVSPTKLDELSIDLTPWLNSLNMSNTYTMIDVTSGFKEEECGLYPLSDFVLEKNFRYRMDDTTNGFLESLDDVQDPQFEIVKVLARTTASGENLYEVAAVMTTRQGDKIVLSDGNYNSSPDTELRANNNNQTMMNKVQEIFAKKKTIFQGLQFKTNYETKYNPNVRKPLCVRMDGFKEENMYLYEDANSQMRYIYDPISKIALSYHYDEDYGDYVLDYYGIRDWVESLPKRNISIMILQNYTIIGL
ncbi:MAC/perforin domain-containing protein [uncultured Bacteroides sp.]|uniref:MAC/perforin domain-containing protein n=1 Tax=uncultured Bacteroides sp. TaxID=162156 RepID=UPI00280BF8AD|nr:MAC/perforin domain-containing protein [uncultured Bacteroides sp.]